MGKNEYYFFSEEQADFFISKDHEVLSGGTQLDIEEEPIQTARGGRWLHTKKIPVFENGEPVYLIGISEDITERKKQQDSIIQLNKELEAFTYSVSHDLRAPLRAVTGYAQILREDYTDTLDSEGKRLLDRISSNAEKMGQLIDELLNFSRLGRKELQKTDTDMNELVAQVVREINKMTPNKAEIRTGNLHKIESDHALMNQVLINLIGNAIKYSSKKEKPEVEINSELLNGEVVFSVKDNGAGFDQRYVNKLFGVFQRLHSGDEFEGTGVGLAIVQRIIDKHGGKVRAEGRVNEGATFYFSIPVNKQ
jgi:light-regulated signal transduction histidine kinase (bacteriophytochrome)